MLAKLTGVSGEAARKWLSGDAIPAMDHIAALAGHFKFSAQWLLTGHDEKSADGFVTLSEEETQIILMLRHLPDYERALALRIMAVLLPRSDQLLNSP